MDIYGGSRSDVLRTLTGYLRLMRPVNCLLIGFAVIVGAVLSRPDFLSIYVSLVYGFFTGFLLTAASMAINDYYDRATDAMNEPQRPIPSGLIKPYAALGFALILTSVGFVAAFLTNVSSFKPFVVAVTAWLALVTYTTVGKRTGFPGNLLVSFCVAIPFIYGSFIAADSLELNVLLFAAMAFLWNTGREVTKGIVDVQGDRSTRIRTLAVSFGERNAAIAGALLYLLAVGLSPVPVLLRLVSLWYVPLVLVTDLGLLFSSFTLLKDYSRENARTIKNRVLLWSLFALLAFLAGTVA